MAQLNLATTPFRVVLLRYQLEARERYIAELEEHIADVSADYHAICKEHEALLAAHAALLAKEGN